MIYAKEKLRLLLLETATTAICVCTVETPT